MSTKNLHMNIYKSFIQDCQNLKATKMSFSRWKHKEVLVHPDKGALCRTKKKVASKPWKYMEETCVCIAKWKKPILKCMVSWKRKDYGPSKISDQQWVFARVEEVSRLITKDT